MKKILITGFEPYLQWPQNASQMLVNSLASSELLPETQIQTVILPVDYTNCYQEIQKHYKTTWDFVLHLGQAPTSTEIALERFALNYKTVETNPTKLLPKSADAYCSDLPLDSWAAGLKQQGFPVKVSNHAGTYLCNAVYFWSRDFQQQNGNPQASLFVHIPLADQQKSNGQEMATLPLVEMENAIRLLLQWIKEDLQKSDLQKTNLL